MKFFFHLRIAALLAAAVIFGGARAEAQSFVGLSVTASTNSIAVSNSVIYTINVTNLTGLLLTDALVTNSFSVPVQFLSATESQGSAPTTNSNTAVFDLGAFAAGGIGQLTLTVQPTTPGFITNSVTVTFIPGTNTASTNIVIQATNIITLADLGVAVIVPAQSVVTNDVTTYGVNVTNLGPSVVANVMLTNTLPPGAILISVLPTNQTYSVASSNLIFNLGTLTNGGYANLQFTIQPTNAGALNFSASVGAADILDTNTANNSASNNITIISYLAGTLLAVTNSAQIVNHQNGLIEQSILLSNVGTNSVPAARLVVTGLTNRLFNAVGTNNGSPFVIYGASLATNQSMTLLLQYFPRNSFPFTNGQLNAFAVPVPNWTPPAATSTSTNLNITRLVTLTNGDTLIEWPAITNRTYTVVYSDNILFSNAMIAPPAIVAPANEVQWIDYGPPTTVSAPTNASARFYRVFLNP
jgi:uncharacterized repeat protein (TIGR01451 family)